MGGYVEVGTSYSYCAVQLPTLGGTWRIGTTYQRKIPWSEASQEDPEGTERTRQEATGPGTRSAKHTPDRGASDVVSLARVTNADSPTALRPILLPPCALLSYSPPTLPTNPLTSCTTLSR